MPVLFPGDEYFSDEVCKATDVEETFRDTTELKVDDSDDETEVDIELAIGTVNDELAFSENNDIEEDRLISVFPTCFSEDVLGVSKVCFNDVSVLSV